MTVTEIANKIFKYPEHNDHNVVRSCLRNVQVGAVNLRETRLRSVELSERPY